MAYVTVDQLKAALADAGGAGARTAASLPDPRLRDNLDQATAEVVGRLSGVFTMPPAGADPDATPDPDTTPPMFRSLIIAVGGYLATLEFNGSQPVEERDPVVLRYARALDLLRQAAGGQLVIEGLERNSGGDTATGDAATYTSTPNVGLGDVFDPSQMPRLNSPAHFGSVVWE